MNTSLRVLLILGLIATFALVTVVSDNGVYWENNSKNCTEGNRIEGSFTNKYGHKCKCTPIEGKPLLTECQQGSLIIFRKDSKKAGILPRAPTNNPITCNEDNALERLSRLLGFVATLLLLMFIIHLFIASC